MRLFFEDACDSFGAATTYLVMDRRILETFSRNGFWCSTFTLEQGLFFMFSLPIVFCKFNNFSKYEEWHYENLENHKGPNHMQVDIRNHKLIGN